MRIRKNLPNILFWIIPFLAFLPQFLMTFNSFGQLRFEELAVVFYIRGINCLVIKF